MCVHIHTYIKIEYILILFQEELCLIHYLLVDNTIHGHKSYIVPFSSSLHII